MSSEDRSEDRSKVPADGAQRPVPVAWAALEDAFENNAPEVHSYLHLLTGDVIRVVDGVADPVTHSRIVTDGGYRRVDPVSSREQYRWMERFIATVEDASVRQRLLQSIDGKGAFRRFKDALMTFPSERERWFSFRSERLKMCMEAWLESQQLSAVARPDWPVPAERSSEPQRDDPFASPSFAPSMPASVPPTVPTAAAASVIPVRRPSATHAPVRLDGSRDSARARLVALAGTLPSSELDAALAFLEFLQERGIVKSASVSSPPAADGAASTPPVAAGTSPTASAPSAPISSVAVRHDADLPPPRRVVSARDHDSRRPASEADASRSAVMPVVDSEGVRKAAAELGAPDADPSRRSSGRV